MGTCPGVGRLAGTLNGQQRLRDADERPNQEDAGGDAGMGVQQQQNTQAAQQQNLC